MIYCKELDKSFESKELMFAALRVAHKNIIADKKARIYNVDANECKGVITARSVDTSKLSDPIKGLEIDSAYWYIAVNTTKILDSHVDLHINSLWNKSAKEQQGKVYLVWDHALKGSATIVRKEHIEILVVEIPFAALGQPYNGNTEALIYKFRKEKVNDDKAKEWLESGDEIQSSVRMQYVKMLFALNSKEPEDKEFKKNYDQYIKQVANIDDFVNGVDYFWPILEAKNVLESSLVLFGSNHVTGSIEEGTKFQPSLDTENKDNQPPSGTEKQKQFYLNI